MVSIEPRWSPSKLEILYADGLVSKRLLDNLGITKTCVLHGDYYHLLKENWPSPENFGVVVYRVIKPFLSAMLLSKTESEWESAFQSASQALLPYPHKLELLQAIHSDPEYYSGYVTRKIIGNLSLNGSAPAEQNHSSVVSFNGDTMLGSICEHIKSLFERQQNICNKENDFENDYIVKSHRYISTLDPQFAHEDIMARQVLSNIPHKDYFVKQLKSSEYLQYSRDTNTMLCKIWPATESFDNEKDDHVCIKIGERCSCWRRVDFDIQCKHELKLNCKFKKSHWGERWYNRKAFNTHHPDLCTFETNLEIIDIDSIVEESNHNINQSMINGISASEAIINVDSNDDHNFIVIDSIKESNNSIVTYKDVLGVATELCRTVANDQKLAKATYVTIHEWINNIRSGDNIKVVFQNHTIKSVTENARTSQSCSTALPRAAAISPTTPGRKRRGRFKSSEELRRGNIHHAYMHKMNDKIL